LIGRELGLPPHAATSKRTEPPSRWLGFVLFWPYPEISTNPLSVRECPAGLRKLRRGRGRHKSRCVL